MSSPYLRDLQLLLQGNGKPLGIGLCLSALSAVLDLLCIAALPLIVGWALSGDARSSSVLQRYFPASAAIDSVLIVAGTVVILFVIRATLNILVGAYLARLTQVIREKVSLRIITNYFHEPYAESLKRSVAYGVSAVGGHTAHFSYSVVMPLMRLGVDLLTIIALLGCLAWFAPLPTAALMLTLGITGLLYSATVRRSNIKHSRRVTELEGLYAEQVTQALQGARETRIYGAQSHFTDEISQTLHRLAFSQARLGAIYWLPRALGELVLILIAVGYMAYTMLHGQSEVIVLSSLSALAFAGMRLLPAVAQCMVGISMLRAGRAVTTLLADELRKTAPTASVTRDLAGTAIVSSPLEEIELSGIRFSYTPEQLVLDGVRLKIQKGQSVGVIGRSGAGKSTLGDILLGLLQPQAGTIHINGEAQVLDGPSWWSRVGFVPQSPYIANQSLARNIAYGLPDSEIDHERLWRAIHTAQLEPLVRSWPEGVEAHLGDHGVKLSGGQRQRVAIARALYRDREFLVLDEATSALDHETEAEVIQALSGLRGKVTTLVIAHRLSTLETCDFVIELMQGQARTVNRRRLS